MDNYYVYIHRRKDSNEVFYIGISRQEKYFRVNTKTGRNPIWNNIVYKYGFIGEVLYSNLSKSEACLIEKALIKSYGRINLKTGCLANLTAGGDGSVDCPKSIETKNKMRKARLGKSLKNMKNNKNPKKIVATKKTVNELKRMMEESKKRMAERMPPKETLEWMRKKEEVKLYLETGWVKGRKFKFN